MKVGTHELLKVIELPGEPLLKFDIAWADDMRRRFYIADRSNARVAVIDLDREEYIGALGEGQMAGAAPTSATSGPNGVVVLSDRGQLWAGDGDSTLKIFDLVSGRLIGVVNTGGAKRVDELAYDDADNLVLAANDKDEPPYACLISTVGDREILGRIKLPQATNGVHQPIWDPRARLFYVPITEVDHDPARGEIVVIDPASKQVIATHPVRECQPAGLALGPGDNLCIACSKNAITAGFAPRSLIMDMSTGQVTDTVFEVGGTDEAWYNPGDERYYLAAAGMVGGPVLGIIDARTNRWVVNVPSSPDSHSVAVDSRTNHAFVALTPTAQFPKGGIGVYGVREG